MKLYKRLTGGILVAAMVIGMVAGCKKETVKQEIEPMEKEEVAKYSFEVSKTLNVGKTLTISAKNLGSNIKWSTSSSSVASIKKVSKTSYKVTAKKAGTATITAKVGSKKYTCKVIVSAPKINGSRSVKVEKGKQATLSLSGVISGTTVAWSVSNSGVASLTRVSNTSYKVTGKKAGTVTVKAVVNGAAYSWTVTVTEPPKPQPNPGLVDGKEDLNEEFGTLF